MSSINRVGHVIRVLMWVFVCYVTFMRIRYFYLVEISEKYSSLQVGTMFYLEALALLLVSTLGLLSYTVFKPVALAELDYRQSLRVFTNTIIVFIFPVLILGSLAVPLFGVAVVQAILLFFVSPTQGVDAIGALSDLTMVLNGLYFWLVLAGICVGFLRLRIKKILLYSIPAFVIGYVFFIMFIFISFHSQKGNWFPTQVSGDNFQEDGVIKSPYSKDFNGFVTSLAYSNDGSLFIGGEDPNRGWRLEKRDATSGKPDRDFGTRGFITGEPETFLVEQILIDEKEEALFTRVSMSYRSDAPDMIEKRNLNDGQLDRVFGLGGFIEDSDSSDTLLLMDDDYLYSLKQEEYLEKISDRDSASRRLKKITLTEINKDTGAKSPEIILNPDSKSFSLRDAIIQDRYLYVLLHESDVRSNKYWVIEKRNLQSGKLVSGFGNGGVVKFDTVYPSGPQHLVSDGAHLYAVGTHHPDGDDWNNGVPPNNLLRIEKISLTNGQSDRLFAKNGSLLIDPDGLRASVDSALLVNDHLFLIGSSEEAQGNWDGIWSTKIFKIAVDLGDIDTTFNAPAEISYSDTSKSPIGIATNNHLIIADDTWRLERRKISDGALE